MVLNEQWKDLLSIFKKIKNRDFTGNKGLAIKNNFYQTLAALTRKIGSLIFTIILARILMPELFGLYNLALSTIVLFSLFSNIGIYDAIIRYLSKAFGQGKNKYAKALAYHFGKIMAVLLLCSIVVLVISAKFIAEQYYQKPILLALLAGGLYIIFLRISSFMISLLQAKDYFKGVFHKELILQIFRIVLVPALIIFFLKQSTSTEFILFIIIIGLALAYLINFIFLFFTVKKRVNFGKSDKVTLSKEKKKEINNFLKALSITVLSGMFFSYIDMIILGRFVSAEFIGYYKAGFSLVSAILPLIGFSTALLPIFSKLKGKRIKRALRKTIKLTLLLSFPLAIIILLTAPLIVNIIYGTDYSPAINILRLFSLILISAPLLDIYKMYYVSIGQPKLIAKFLLIATFLNLGLNFLFITILLPIGQLSAVFGVTIASILSNYFILFGLIFSKKGTESKSFKESKQFEVRRANTNIKEQKTDFFKDKLKAPKDPSSLNE